MFFFIKTKFETISLFHCTESRCKLVISWTGNIPDWSSPHDPARVLAAVGRRNPSSIKRQMFLVFVTRFGRKKTMVILLTAIILSGVANRFAPNYPAFLIGLHFNVRYLKLLLPGVFLCAFMSLAYGTVMYVWMMEHCDGEFLH